MENAVKIGDLILKRSGPFFVVAGPCVIEDEKTTLVVAEFLCETREAMGIPVIFKASYDKANRTSLDSFRGPGIESGLRILEKVKELTGLPVLSDVHSPEEAQRAAGVLDVLQIPAFLCRQTSLLVKAGSSGKMVNIKKGQFLSPQNMKHAIEKVEHGGGSRIAVTERGTFFGYGDLVVDMRSFTTMRCFGYPVFFDATHSTQRPGGLGTATGGNRKLSGPLSRAAVAYGIDGLYLEVHPCPEKALSDAACQLDYESSKRLIVDAVNIHNLLREMH